MAFLRPTCTAERPATCSMPMVALNPYWLDYVEYRALWCEWQWADPAVLAGRALRCCSHAVCVRVFWLLAGLRQPCLLYQARGLRPYSLDGSLTRLSAPPLRSQTGGCKSGWV